MRPAWLSLTALLLAAPLAPAQQAAQTKPTVTIDQCLQRWERAVSGLKSVKAECTRTDLHRTWGSTDVLTGSFLYLEPNLFSLYMERKDKKEVYEKLVCTGTYIYQWAPAEKKVNLIDVPKSKDNENIISMLFTVKADAAKKRYDLAVTGEDKFYLYVSIKPKLAQDKADFTEARLVLNKDTYMPRELWFKTPTKDESKWDIPKVQTNVSVDRKLFEKPDLPKEWKLDKAQPQQPRVIREQR
jgi:TIGR03009 family protein